MESEHQAERVSEESSKKDTFNNLPNDLEEAIKAIEKSLEGLENIVKLLKSDIKKPLPFDVTDPVLPYNSTKTSLGKWSHAKVCATSYFSIYIRKKNTNLNYFPKVRKKNVKKGLGAIQSFPFK